jgi:hypothetical protein
MKRAHLLLALLGMCLWPLAARSADLAQIDRQIAKEPQYQHKPKYALAVLGLEARLKVWLVSDGDVLYVDKNGNGDLTEAEERFASPKDVGQLFEFKVGDIKVGDQVYRDLTVYIGKLSSQSHYADLPAYQKLLAADANARWYHIGVDVPTSLDLTDEKGRKVTHIWHLASDDANGFLQFAERPADAPVIHFGGPWQVWPRGGQKFVLDRPEEFTTFIGTPGHGAGTFAITMYHTAAPDSTDFVPKTAKPVVEAKFRTKEGGTFTEKYMLEHKC